MTLCLDAWTKAWHQLCFTLIMYKNHQIYDFLMLCGNLSLVEICL